MIIFSPSTSIAVSRFNAASIPSISTQHQSSLSLSQDPKQANSQKTQLPPANLLSLTTPAKAPSTTATITSNTSKCGSGKPRNKQTWPFACNSIWNMPVGSGAKYVDAYIGSKYIGVDTDWFVPTQENDPSVPAYMITTWGAGRCTGTTPQQQAQWHPEAGQPVKVPYNFIVPDATAGGTPNNSSAFLMPDGKTLVSFNGTARCQQGGPLYGNWFGLSDIYGDGIAGGHGGSAMSSIGGSIRKGELLNDTPIHHALKIDIWGNWLHYSPTSPTPGRRWPAILADGGAANQYKGSNPALVMGSLLAIPPNATAQSLGLTTKTGKKLFQALQDYGAYVVDDSGWDYNYLCIERSAAQEYEKVSGHSLDSDAAFQSDFAKIVAAVKVVDNNGPNSIGGGGEPRQPFAPPIGN